MRPDVARKRARWKAYQDRIAPSQLVFIDETWVKTRAVSERIESWEGFPNRL